MLNVSTSESVYCPYCDTLNTISVPKKCLVFPYPRIFPIEITYGSKLSDKIFSFLESRRILIKKIDEKEIQCIGCKNVFSTSLFLQDASSPLYDERMKNRINFLLEKEDLLQYPPFFERFLGGLFNRIASNNNFFKAYLILALPVLLILGLQSAETGTTGLLYDPSFDLLFLLFGALIYIFDIFNQQFHRSFNISELPFMISENYKKSRYGKLFEAWKIKDSIYDFWRIPFSNKRIHHATAYGLLLALAYSFFYTLLVLLPHRNLFVGIPNFDFTLSIIYMIYWMIVCFIFGNILYLLFNTAPIITKLFSNIPVKIDIFKKFGGFNSIFSLCNMIILQVILIVTIGVVWLFGLTSSQFLKIEYNAFIQQPLPLILLIIMFIFWVAVYVTPPLIIAKKYQNAIEDYIDKLGMEIKAYYPHTYECNVGELQDLEFRYNLAKSLPDWPSKINIRVIIAYLVPIVSLIVAILRMQN